MLPQMKQIKAAVRACELCPGTAGSGYLPMNAIPFVSRKFMLPQIYDFKS